MVGIHFPLYLYDHGQIVGNKNVALTIPDGGTAYLTTDKGQAPIRIRPSKHEINRVLVGVRGKSTLIVGNIADDGTDGLNALRHYAAHESPNETTYSFLAACCRNLAEKAGIL